MESVAANRTALSDEARRRKLAIRGESMFYARWDRAVFIHYAVDPVTLQREIPFELDLREGRAYVSLVAFTLMRMRPRIGGRIGEWMLKPIAAHEFLNVRTYVRHGGEPGIYFLAEWLNNRAAVLLGPRSFGLPYRFGKLAYRHARDTDALFGTADAHNDHLVYEGKTSGESFEPCEAESLTEFLLERYTAFTQNRKQKRFFRVWHAPWPQAPAEFQILDASLIATTGQWWRSARWGDAFPLA